MSRISDTPVSLAPPTLNPAWLNARTIVLAAAVFPAFMQVPRTYTTGGTGTPLRPVSAASPIDAGCGWRDWNSG